MQKHLCNRKIIGRLWAGCGGSAALTGYVDDLMLLDMTAVFGDKQPTRREMDQLYTNFLILYQGGTVSEATEVYRSPYPVYEYHADEQVNIASGTKVLTAMVALDYIHDLDQEIVIKASDIQPGTGPVFKGGETITMRDALYALMLPSSNTCAYTIARTIGYQLLEHYPD